MTPMTRLLHCQGIIRHQDGNEIRNSKSKSTNTRDAYTGRDCVDSGHVDH